jgi:hypothetical protein
MMYGQTLIDPKVSMRIILARVLWLEGSADQAVQVAAEAVEIAASDGPAAMLQSLGMAACPVALWRGDRDAAQGYIDSLFAWSQRYAFNHWINFALCFRTTLEGERNDVMVVDRPTRTLPGAHGVSTMNHDTLATIAEMWIDEPTLDRARRGLCGWAGPEVLRAAAARGLRRGDSNSASTTESIYLKALHGAQAQRALAWELRIVISLAQLWRGQGRPKEASNALRAILKRFKKGIETADLTAARQLQENLGAPS